MHDIRAAVDGWLAEGHRVALATVLSAWGSAPRKSGAALAVVEGGDFAGSVTAGCVEGAVIEAALEILAGAPPRRLGYRVSDDRAWSLGLACGGEIALWVAPLDATLWRSAWAAVDARQSAAWSTVVGGPQIWLGRECLAAGPLFNGEGSVAIDGAGSAAGPTAPVGSLELAALLAASGAARDTSQPQARLVAVEAGRDTLEVFVNPLQPRRRLLIVGATHIAQDLVRLAATVDLETVVIDPRAAFANRERFPTADVITVAWPAEALRGLQLDADTAVAVLSHDPKIDDDVLALALPSAAGYVGALGSRHTQTERRERLAAMGLPAEALAGLHGPIGLDIGARTPAEIALSILAQVVAVANGRSGAG
jgi:xanthine dehydrogenase accessory factor